MRTRATRRPITTETQLPAALPPILLSMLQNNPQVSIVPCTSDLFARGIALFSSRMDKAWTLTDCVSFVVMHEYGISEALTGDHHFEQAGFNILLGKP